MKSTTQWILPFILLLLFFGSCENQYDRSNEFTQHGVDPLKPWIRLRTINETQNEDVKKLLLDFFNATGGPHWIRKDGWSINSPTSYCQWYGVECADDGLIVKLALDSNNVSGKLPPSLSELPLLRLHLRSNSLTGQMPSAYCNFNMITHIFLANNKLEGTIPECIGQLSSLIAFSLASNNLNGSLPASLFNLQRLNALLLSYNKFTGSVLELAQMKSLSSLAIDHNQFQGPLPNMKLMIELSYADFSFNQFSEVLPLASIVELFLEQSLAYFSSISNPLLTYPTDPQAFSLIYFAQSSSVLVRSQTWSCLDVKIVGTDFPIYIDPIFNRFKHCSCFHAWYGRPPDNCYSCPLPTDFCPGGPKLSWPNDRYPIFVNTSTTPIAFETCSTPNACSNKCALIIEQSAPFEFHYSHSNPTQCPCTEGRSGRQCSQCLCDVDGHFNKSAGKAQYCYFNVGRECHKCAFTLNQSQGRILLSMVIFIAFLLMTVTNFLVMRHRRLLASQERPQTGPNFVQKVTRVFTVGYFKITIIWLQSLAGIATKPAAFALTAQLFNGDLHGIGLPCFFPSLSKSLAYYIFHGILPIAICLMLILSIFVCVFIFWISERWDLWNANGRIGDRQDKTLPKLIVDGSEKFYTYTDSQRFSEGFHNTLDDSPLLKDDDLKRFTIPGNRVPRRALTINGSYIEYNDDSDDDYMEQAPELQIRTLHDDRHRNRYANFSTTPTKSLTPYASEDESSTLFYDNPMPHQLHTGAETANTPLPLIPVSSIISHCVAVLYFFYFGITLHTFSFFLCQKQPGTGISFLQSHMWMECSSPETRTLRLVTIPFLLIITIGTPTIFSYVLLGYRREIATRTISDLGGLHRCYKSSLSWWELVVTARRFLLAVALQLIPNTSEFQSLAVLLVLSVSIAVQYLCKPFVVANENRAEVASLLLLMLTYANQNSVSISDASYILSWIIASLNTAFLIFVIGMVFYSWRRASRYPDEK